MKSLFTESAVTLPSRAGRSRAGLQLPLSQTAESTSSHLPCDRHGCDTGMGVSMAAAPQPQLRNSAGASHHVQNVHVRQRLGTVKRM